MTDLQLQKQLKNEVLIKWNSDINQLLNMIKRNDKTALKVLYDETNGKLLGIIIRIIHDRYEAEECLQEVFVKIWKQADKYSGAGSAWGWLCVLTRNAALDQLRRLRAHPHISTDDDDNSLLSTLFNEEDLNQEHSIRSCLSRLKEQPRQAILLSFIHGYSHGELSAQLNTPLGTIKAWVRRGLQELKTCLA
ncbi:MAG: RNA polymerase sigma-70 factor (ECF subfamily) [Cellvibrionaceae bacterium]